MATMATFLPIHPSYDLPIRPIANDIYDFQDLDLPYHYWTQVLKEDFTADADWVSFIHDIEDPNSAYVPPTELCATLQLSPFQTPPTPEPEPNLTQEPDVTADVQSRQQVNIVTDILNLPEYGKMGCEESKPPCLGEVKQEQFEDLSESETKMDNEETGKQETLQSRDDETFPKTEERPHRNLRYHLRPIPGPSTRQSRPTVRKTTVLWKFLKDLLDTNETSCVEWISKEEGTFKFVDSKLAAKLWGQKKNKRNMTYEKLSRALRYYYERQIMFHEEGQKLIYRFGDIVMKNRNQSVAEAS